MSSIALWRSRDIGGRKYAIKCLPQDEPDCYKIWLSDLMRIWIETFTTEDLVNRCKLLNPFVEAKPERIVAKSLALLDSDIADFTLSVLPEEGRTLIVCSRMACVPFRAMFNFHLDRPEEMYEEITLPLLMLVQDLQIKQMVIVNQLKIKDNQMTHMKLEMSRLSKDPTQHFKTEASGGASGLAVPTPPVFTSPEQLDHSLTVIYGGGPPRTLTDPFEDVIIPGGTSSVKSEWNDCSTPMKIFTKSAEYFGAGMDKDLPSVIAPPTAAMLRVLGADVKMSSIAQPKGDSSLIDPTELRMKCLALEKAKKLAKQKRAAKRKPALRL